MKQFTGNRVMVAIAVSALTASAYAETHKSFTVEQSTEDLAADKEIARLRAILEMNPIKPMVEQHQKVLSEIVVGNMVGGIDNMLLAATATAKDMGLSVFRVVAGKAQP